MKRAVFMALLLSAVLHAYELGVDNLTAYSVFDPAQRIQGMTYPASWVLPDPFLHYPEYEDSSRTIASWNQLIDFGGTGLSNFITAQYIPYSYPERWSIGLNFTSYNGPSPVDRNQAVFDYKHTNGRINVFHISGDHTLKLWNRTLTHSINSNSIEFDHHLGKKCLVSGGLDFQRIEQTEASADTLRRYDADHEYLRMTYSISDPLQIYGHIERRYILNDTEQNTLLVFRPGLRYNKGGLMAHLAAWMSPSQFYPVAQFALSTKFLFLETYANVRDPLYIFRQPAHPYYGIKAGIDHQGERQTLKAQVEYSYDHTGVTSDDAAVLPFSIPPYFYSLNSSAEYRLHLNAIELYLKGAYREDFDFLNNYYYYPEKGLAAGGLIFHSKLANGKLLLDGDINAQYIEHENPDSVSFDPVTLSYDADPGVSTVGNWKLNVALTARIMDFSISARISSPVNFNNDISWHIYNGIYTSSDLLVGNTFYAGLTVSWLWWK